MTRSDHISSKRAIMLRSEPCTLKPLMRMAPTDCNGFKVVISAGEITDDSLRNKMACLDLIPYQQTSLKL